MHIVVSVVGIKKLYCFKVNNGGKKTNILEAHLFHQMKISIRYLFTFYFISFT